MKSNVEFAVDMAAELQDTQHLAFVIDLQRRSRQESEYGINDFSL